MDSGGGPGPPRPADSSGSHLPSSHDGYVELPQSNRITRLNDLNLSQSAHYGRAVSQQLPQQSYRSTNRSVLTSQSLSANAFHVPFPENSNLGLFPFNPAVAQQPSQLGAHIPSNRSSADPGAQTSTPFSNLPFIPGVPQPNPSVAIPPNNPQRINPQTNMLHQINAVASAANHSSTLQAGNLPQNAQQSSTNDFFGELEKVLASRPGPTASTAKGADVLDSALSMALPGHPSSQQQSARVIGAQRQPQLQNAHLQQQQQQRLQQHLQLQEQLQQQLRQQQQRLRHPSALHQSLLSRQQQQIHPYLQQTHLAPGQLNTGVHAHSLGTNLAGQTSLPSRQIPQQSLSSGGLGLDSHGARGDGKTRRKQQNRRPRTGSGATIPIVPGTQMPNALAPGSLAAAHQRQQIPILPGQLAFNSRQGQFQQNPLHLQQNPVSLQGSLAQQPQPSHSGQVPGGVRSSIVPGSFPLNNAGSLLGSSTLQQQARAGHNASQSGLRHMSSGLVSGGNVPQRIPQGNPEMAKFDAATLQNVLRSTHDPKIKATINQQLEYLQYKAGMTGASQQRQPQPSQHHLSSGLRTNSQHLGSLPQPGDILNQNSSRVPQAAILQRQQLLQKQQLFRQQQQIQQQQIQQQHQLQLRKQASLAHPQQTSVPGFPSQSLPSQSPPSQSVPGSRQAGGVAPLARESSTPPNRLGNHILGQQLQHSNRRAQHSQSSHSQSASQGAPSDLVGEGQHSSSQNSQRQSSTRRPRRSHRVARNEAEAANGVSGISADFPVHQGRITRSRVSTGQVAENHVRADRLSRLDSSQSRKPGVHGLVQPPLTRSPAEAVEQAAQAAQLAAVRTARANIRTADDKKADDRKAAEDRKRVERETELSNIEEQKKRRLQTAPWNDYQRILAPDYTTPFSDIADAWQRLVPYHVVLTDEDASVSQDEWNVEIDKLSKKYKDCFRSLRESFDRLFDAGFESIGSAAELPGYGSLCKDDSLILDNVLLRDYYETARKQQALIAREKESRIAAEMERRRVAEMHRQRSIVQREELIAQNAIRMPGVQVGLLGSPPATRPHGTPASSGIAASGALPPVGGPGLLPTLSRRSEALPSASSLPGAAGSDTKNGPSFPQGPSSQYNQRQGLPSTGTSPSVSVAGLHPQANFGSQGNAQYIPSISASHGVPHASSTALGQNAPGMTNAAFRETPKDLTGNSLGGSSSQGYAQPIGITSHSVGVPSQAKLPGTVPNASMYHRNTSNGPGSMGQRTTGAKANASDGMLWSDGRVQEALQSSSAGAQAGIARSGEIFRNGMQESGQAGLPASNLLANTARVSGSVPLGIGAMSTADMRIGGKSLGPNAHASSLNGSHHETLKPKLPGLDDTNSGLIGGQNMTSFGRPVGSRASSASPYRDVEAGIPGGHRVVTPHENIAPMGICGSMITDEEMPNLQREATAGTEKANNSGVMGLDGRVGVLPSKANEAGRQAKGGELGGLGMGSLLNADGS